MRHFLKMLFRPALGALIWYALCSIAVAAPDVFPVEDVAPGLIGTGYTVVQGQKIEPFSAEILGVLENAGPAGSLVLVRVSGDAIERAGGIAAGMSGSPVYVDGRLLGAIGYGFEMTDHRIGLVTPAVDMFEVLDLVNGESTPEVVTGRDESDRASVDHVGAPEWVALAESSEDAQIVRSEVPEGVWVASPVATPLVVSGLGTRTMSRLRTLVDEFDVLPMVGGSDAGADEGVAGALPQRETSPFKPGSAIGVQLMRGDIDVTAIGTVTHVEDGSFLAFGHPFLNRGEADYFASRAEILLTVPSLTAPFKVGTALGAVGRVTQDRSAAIGGRVGEQPDGVKLTVKVSDIDRRETSELSATAVRDESLLAPLMAIGALEALDRGIDRIGAGTSWVEFSIGGEGMARRLTRSNMFYSQSDISAQSLVESYEALLTLQENEFKNPELTSVDVTVRISEDRRTATVVKAEPQTKRVRSGERVLIDVTLRPFRDDPFTLTVPLDIPEGVSPGEVTVTVQGGGFGTAGYLPEDLSVQPGPGDTGEGEQEEHEERTPAESLGKIIEDFETRPRNNDLVIEFYPPYGTSLSPETADQAESDGGSSDHDRPSILNHDEPVGEPGAEPAAEAFATDAPYGLLEPIRETRTTQYVVEGEAYFTLTIEKPEVHAEPSTAGRGLGAATPGVMLFEN